jgi:prolyl-tRNA editing enzyme YbaK/EbsC (Cys-tRNA(Pro) deacylase)
VDLGKLNALTGKELKVASPDHVRSRTDHVIGGVPPFPHNQDVLVVPDTSLTRFPYIWTVSGAQNAVMRISTDCLIATIARQPSDLAQR